MNETSMQFAVECAVADPLATQVLCCWDIELQIFACQHPEPAQ